MTLKEQIEATIKEYKEACKPENLNYHYCIIKDIHHGICYYCEQNKFFELLNLIHKDSFIFLTHQPFHIQSYLNYSEFLLKIHKIRINYLKNLLKQIKSRQFKTNGTICQTKPIYFL